MSHISHDKQYSSSGLLGMIDCILGVARIVQTCNCELFLDGDQLKKKYGTVPVYLEILFLVDEMTIRPNRLPGKVYISWVLVVGNAPRGRRRRRCDQKLSDFSLLANNFSSA